MTKSNAAAKVTPSKNNSLALNFDETSSSSSSSGSKRPPSSDLGSAGSSSKQSRSNISYITGPTQDDDDANEKVIAMYYDKTFIYPSDELITMNTVIQETNQAKQLLNSRNRYMIVRITPVTKCTCKNTANKQISYSKIRGNSKKLMKVHSIKSFTSTMCVISGNYLT